MTDAMAKETVILSLQFLAVVLHHVEQTFADAMANATADVMVGAMANVDVMVSARVVVVVDAIANDATVKAVDDSFEMLLLVRVGTP